VIDDYYSGISIGLANLVFACNPEVIILGGALVESKCFNISKIKKYLDDHFKQPQSSLKQLKITKAKLGNKAALYGAAINCIKHLDEK